VGLLSPVEGSIKVDSGGSVNLHSASWRGQIGFVPQEPFAHRLITLRRCDTIFLLDQGKLVAQGTHAELMKSNTLFQSLAGEAPPGDTQLK
jgi:ABC-type multidrug transport system fused ATPase/permease subunit